MPHVRRDEASAILRDGQERLDDLLGGMSEGDLVRPATIGGGDWSAKDLIGHVAAWEELAVQALAEWRRGQMPVGRTTRGSYGGLRTGGRVQRPQSGGEASDRTR